MNRPRLIRGIKITWTAICGIAWSVVCAIACVLVVALWLRSYWRADGYSVAISKFTFVGIASSRGAIKPFRVDNGGGASFGTWQIDNDAIEGKVNYQVATLPSYRGAFGFGVRRESSNSLSQVVVPHWFCAIAAGALATFPWLPYRFTLRTLLIATSLVAVALSLVIYASK
jgi:hypothetical protein